MKLGISMPSSSLKSYVGYRFTGKNERFYDKIIKFEDIEEGSQNEKHLKAYREVQSQLAQ